MAISPNQEKVDQVREAFMVFVHSLPKYEPSEGEVNGNKVYRVKLIREAFYCGLKNAFSLEETCRFYDKR